MLEVSSVCVDGIKYHPSMIIFAGSCSGLPEFVQIEMIVVADAKILFACHKITAWYVEHLRSYQLHCNNVTAVCDQDVRVKWCPPFGNIQGKI